MTIFVTSDLHLGHVRCATEFRGFASVEAHNETIVRNWNETVTPEDEVWVLGDLCMGKIADSLALAATLNGRKLLIPGNHDRMHPSYHHKGDKDAARERWRMEYEAAGFTILGLQVPCTIRNQDLLLCHFPFSADHEEFANEPRYPEFRPEDDGSTVLLHGHIHDLRKEDVRQINVGVDVWDFRPVPFADAVAAAG